MGRGLRARIGLVVAAVCSVLVLAAWQRDSDSCDDAVKDVLFAIRDRDARIDAFTERVGDECEGSGRLIDSGGVLFQHGYTDQAAATLREAVEREPDSFSAWAGLAAVLRDEDPEAAAEAAGRARSLNRYYRLPLRGQSPQ